MLASSQELPPLPSTPSSSHTAPTHRLLYRGALSLPDSYLLLDGLSFVAETRSGIQGSPSVNLLSNSLALALESMRGRPSLHLVGTQRVEDVWLDGKTTVSVFVVISLGVYFGFLNAKTETCLVIIDMYIPNPS